MWILTRIALVLVVSVGSLGSCKNEQHCPGNLNDDCRLEDAQATCTASGQCEDPTPVCDIGTMTCVQCTPAEAGACTATTPVCGDDNKCRGCSTHTECSASDVCLPEGRCAEPDEVAYVKAGGTGAPPCAKGAPCGTLQEGITAANASRPVIKISGTGTLADDQTTTIDGKAVTILADPGAKLDRTGDGVILEVRNAGADVRIYDLEITGASGGVGDVGISIAAGGMPKLALTRAKVTNNTGGGISASGGMLTVSQSTILGNTGGGILISGTQFDITNSIIVKNGGPNSGLGGIQVNGIVGNGTRRFEFNTVAQNQATTGITPGVLCSAVAMPFVLTNSIVYDNGTGIQVEGANCSWTYSDIGPTAAPGTGNINAPPMFVNAMQSNFHLQSGSPVKDAADPAASLAIDIDGDTRPQGDGRDMGADEIR